jgi:hypothetical protein
MALPADFWRDDRMLNIFRTKPCQRLLRSGTCDWRSQCQFSHSLGWPRRPPTRSRYTPEICESVLRGLASGGGFDVECPNGQRCPRAHTKEEVLYHPQVFKTSLCEEHQAAGAGGRTMRGTAGRSRCHRYYCPYAHGNQELRDSPMDAEKRQRIMLDLEYFPSDDCCQACLPSRHFGTSANAESTGAHNDGRQPLADGSGQPGNGGVPATPPGPQAAHHAGQQILMGMPGMQGMQGMQGMHGMQSMQGWAMGDVSGYGSGQGGRLAVAGSRPSEAGSPNGLTQMTPTTPMPFQGGNVVPYQMMQMAPMQANGQGAVGHCQVGAPVMCGNGGQHQMMMPMAAGQMNQLVGPGQGQGAVMANPSDALRAMLQSAGIDKHFDAFWRAGARPGCGHLWPLALSSRTS